MRIYSMKKEKSIVGNAKMLLMVIFMGVCVLITKNAGQTATKIQYCEMTEQGEVTKYYSKVKFLKKFGCREDQRLFQCEVKKQGKRIEVYYNKKSGKCCGICYRDGEAFGFATTAIHEMMSFSHDKYAINPDGKTSELKTIIENCGVTGVKTTKKKNKAGKLTRYKITGKLEGELYTIVDVKFTYSKKGVLSRKTAAYHPFVFGTSQSYEEFNYNSSEQLISDNAYMTHGTWESYYCYQSKKDEIPKYYVTLDYYTDYIDANLYIRK